jgi:hypothetical protein
VCHVAATIFHCLLFCELCILYFILHHKSLLLTHFVAFSIIIIRILDYWRIDQNFGYLNLSNPCLI